MFEAKLKASETRKQLLVAESELNRTLLLQDWRILAHSVDESIRPIRTVRDTLSTLASLAGVFKSAMARNSHNGESAPRRPGVFSSLLRLGLETLGSFQRSSLSGASGDHSVQ